MFQKDYLYYTHLTVTLKKSLLTIHHVKKNQYQTFQKEIDNVFWHFISFQNKNN
jgi:hypothetical protein